MDLTHRFTVPTGVEETWSHFQDIEALAECFPGATVSSVEGDSFTGSAKVKLGPIALVYNGSGSITEKDEGAHRMLVEAKGKDKRGNGTAGATVTLTMSGGEDSTDVEVVTDLSITGKPAQFGRGVMQDVSDKLLAQFVDCLEQRLAGGTAEDTAEQATQDTAGQVGSGAGTSGEALTSGGASAAASGVGSPNGVPAGASGGPSASASAPRHAAGRSGGSGGSGGEAIDLGATVLPVLARTYWKHALGALVVLLVLRRLLRR